MRPLCRSVRAILTAFFAGLFLAGIHADVHQLGAQDLPPIRPIEARVSGAELAAGGRISCELPAELHRKNIGSPPPRYPGDPKSLGCCVFTSIHHSALWQNLPVVQEMPKWMVSKGIPGGGYPRKVAALVTQIAKERGLPEPEYLQVEDGDLEILKLACRTGRMPAVTYGVSPTGRYNGQLIAHMVSLVHADDREFVVLDNNYIGERNYEHMSPQEFRRSYTTSPGPRGGSIQTNGWAVILLTPGAPPAPDGAAPPPPPPAPWASRPHPSPAKPAPRAKGFHPKATAPLTVTMVLAGEHLEVAKAIAAGTSDGRKLLVRGRGCHAPAGVKLRVFLARPDANRDTPATVPQCVGTVEFPRTFERSEPSDFRLDLTPALRAVGPTNPVGTALRLTLVVVPAVDGTDPSVSVAGLALAVRE